MPRILLLLAVIGSVAPPVAVAEQPNILFLFSDDHAVQAISAYGSKINKTPNLDRIADSGMIFENSFCCNSICGPSRAAILTGKHSHKNGFLGNFSKAFDGTQQTFPKLLQKAGYETAVIGKWHLKSNPTGFDHWEILPGQGSYYNPDFYGPNGKKRYTGYCTTVNTDLALEWLDNRQSKKPFMLMCQYKAPHRTWAPELEDLDEYVEDVPEPATLFDNYQNRSKTLAKNAMSIDKHFYYAYDLKVHQDVPFSSKREKRLKDGEYRRMNAEQKAAWDAHYKPLNDAFLKAAPKGKDLVRWKYQRYIKNYLRCVHSVDRNVGRLLDWLEAKGLRENTIVVYSSDQGFYLGEHGWYDKRWAFEESIRMPLLVSWPKKIKAGSRLPELVQNIDYAPTFLQAAGVDVPEDMQGESLMPLFNATQSANAKKSKWRDAVYYHYYEHGGEHQVPRHEAVRSDRYKLINFYSNDEMNLFDLKQDPHELKSVHADPEYAPILAQMKTKLEFLRKTYDLPERAKKR